MDDWDLKALEAAHDEGLKGHDALQRAQQIYDWVRGRDGGAGLIGGGTARVVGRDGMLQPPFDDYIKGE